MKCNRSLLRPPKRYDIARPTTSAASWRSGDAADCKSVYTGSIPVLASIYFHDNDNKIYPCRIDITTMIYCKLSCESVTQQVYMKEDYTLRQLKDAIEKFNV